MTPHLSLTMWDIPPLAHSANSRLRRLVKTLLAIALRENQIVNVLKQIRRLQIMISMMKKDHPRSSPWHQQGINRNWTLFSNHHSGTGVALNSELSHLFTCPSETSLARIVASTKLLKVYQSYHQAWADSCNGAAEKSKRDNLKNSPYDRAAYRHVSAEHTAPLIALQRADGTFATNAADIDDLLIEQWRAVYQGNAPDQHAAV